MRRFRRPNHSLGAALALGAVLAAHALCWTVLPTSEARPAGIWSDGSRQSAVGSRSQERLPSAPRSASLRSTPPPPDGVADGRALANRLPTADTRLPFLLVHSAPSGWAYPLECCSNQDCREVADADVFEGPDGYVIRATGEVVPYDDARVKDSPDGRFHWCALGDGLSGPGETSTICLFVPPRGF